MEKLKLKKTVLCCILTAIIACTSSFTVFAVDPEPSENIGVPVETVAETEVVDVTDPFTETEPIYTEVVPTTESYVETTEYYEEETTFEPVYDETTEPVSEEAETPVVTEYIDFEEEIFGNTISPTQRSTSTVSTKRYETNLMAGTVSWACIIIGVLVLISFIASTKFSGRKNRKDN